MPCRSEACTGENCSCGSDGAGELAAVTYPLLRGDATVEGTLRWGVPYC